MYDLALIKKYLSLIFVYNLTYSKLIKIKGQHLIFPCEYKNFSKDNESKA